MLFFGHSGITLGVGWLLKSTCSGNLADPVGKNEPEQAVGSLPSAFPAGSPSQGIRAQLVNLVRKADLRLLLLGSLLPDILDKPIGQVFFRETFSSGQIFAHTLLFLIVITLLGIYVYRGWGKSWLIVLSFATFIHLIRDQMWLAPRTILWPLHGWAFEKIDLTHWVQNIFHAMRTAPSVYVPELVGVIILAGFVVTLAYRKKVYAFIRNGQAL